MDEAGFEIVTVPEAARAYVRRCMYANRRLAESLTLRPKPTGYMYFTRWFGDSRKDGWTVNGVWYPRRSRFYLAGQIVEDEISVRVDENLQIVFCELTATACHRLFGVPGKVLAGKAPPLGDVDDKLELLARGHFVAGAGATREQHMEEIAGFFAALAKNALPADDVVEAAVDLFEAHNGAIRVADVCGQVGIGPRQLNRRFTQIVGLTPKLFGQILQINWVVGMLYFNDSEKLTEIAQGAGFYDQAHFNHAMQRFFQEGPRAFLRSDHVAFKTFLGASRRFGPSSSPSPSTSAEGRRRAGSSDAIPFD
jgi:AraC-like DNA-binding protein